jgi:hypothetical protein
VVNIRGARFWIRLKGGRLGDTAQMATEQVPPSREDRASAFRAIEVARSAERGSRRGTKAGVRIRDPKHFVCIHPAMERFADEQPSVRQFVRSASERAAA